MIDSHNNCSTMTIVLKITQQTVEIDSYTQILTGGHVSKIDFGHLFATKEGGFVVTWTQCQSLFCMSVITTHPIHLLVVYWSKDNYLEEWGLEALFRSTDIDLLPCCRPQENQTTADAAAVTKDAQKTIDDRPKWLFVIIECMKVTQPFSELL
jgi:hypothetical protein